MSQCTFDPHVSILTLDARLHGKVVLHARLVLDTGASFTVLPWRIVTGLGIGIDPTNLVSTTTASSVESAPLVILPKVAVLAQSVKNVECLVKDLPAESGVDGLLGLSYLRHFKTTVDFRNGILTLE